MSVERAKSDLEQLELQIALSRQHIAEAEAQAEKIRAYLELAAVYGAIPTATHAPLRAFVGSAASRGGPREAGVGISHQATNAVVERLKDLGRPTHTRELLKYVETKGMHIGGKDPVANLSGFLSRSGLLVSSRMNGWSLKEWTQQAAIPEKDGGESSSETVSALQDQKLSSQ